MEKLNDIDGHGGSYLTMMNGSLTQSHLVKELLRLIGERKKEYP